MTASETRATQRPALYGDQKLKLGLFGFNASGGMVMMRDAPLKIEWDTQVSIARKADALDFDLLVPVARWRGYGGDTDYNGISFESFTWAAGMSAATERIMVLSTVHVPLTHPITAAKMGATIDHISGGRFGMNVVMGWNEAEFGMFGLTQAEHDSRYRYGHEWLEIVKRLWHSDPPFDYDGEFFQLEGVQGQPKPPQGQPVILNAGTSPAAMEFASRDVDFLFGVPPTIDAMAKLVDDAHATAQRFDRDLGYLTCAMIICRDTLGEAEAVYEDILARGDWNGAAAVMNALSLHSGSFDETLRDFAARFVVGFGTHVIVGTPDMVVDELQRISDAGVQGVLMGFVDFDGEMDYFGEKVMPLLKEAGLRH
jgi:alkanesulfonate monooxygenase SsuD/methylene tetrahydromethanopterin reductase-like flavin-dependent oxidoreductase (luciferase family)